MPGTNRWPCWIHRICRSSNSCDMESKRYPASGARGGGNQPAQSWGFRPPANANNQTRMARTKMLLLAVVGTLALTSIPAVASDNPEEAMQKPQQFKRRITTVVGAKYLLYLPKDYSPKSRQRWPLIFFFHGAGEPGTNLALGAVHGPPKLVKQKREFPFIIVSPHCPEADTWSNDVRLCLLDTIMKKYRVDPNRVYLTGLSM